ncbi:hypothetical protein SAMN05443633_1134 [Chryseobacterium arachidis]|uniref:Uncharacterized protein n=1 Tax=Chryseobacterium arachidis TaxID=1416778 RepID=A0A1M5IM18_9FLAO|nr:hypothetical protein [Chryseobacterium arachidis]SHG29327.1 hypothetical protein SAMN05443633_1134 [Chryseobacterium arachidis]
MMSFIKFNILTCLILSCGVFSQTSGNADISLTLPSVTLMDVEPSGTIAMNYTAPTEAGNPVTTPAANTTKWINYTSAYPTTGVSRRITASINPVIPGIDIRIQALAASGGGGTLGTPTAQITLGTTAQNIITGIGRSFTGNGNTNGHRLTITLTTNTYANITARNSTPVIITYTITE